MWRYQAFKAQKEQQAATTVAEAENNNNSNSNSTSPNNSNKENNNNNKEKEGEKKKKNKSRKAKDDATQPRKMCSKLLHDKQVHKRWLHGQQTAILMLIFNREISFSRNF